MRHEAYLGLGSNLGDRAANIARGLAGLEAASSSLTASSLYETAPAGFEPQPPFLNVVCRVWTALDPFQMLWEAERIASEVGHGRAFPNAPRALDIDLLLYGRTILSAPLLEIPHPRMAERAFVMVPLAEIAPGLVHPQVGETAFAMASRLPDRAAVRRVRGPGRPVRWGVTAF